LSFGSAQFTPWKLLGAAGEPAEAVDAEEVCDPEDAKALVPVAAATTPAVTTSAAHLRQEKSCTVIAPRINSPMN
jgi:hypothetical protein